VSKGWIGDVQFATHQLDGQDRALICDNKGVCVPNRVLERLACARAHTHARTHTLVPPNTPAARRAATAGLPPSALAAHIHLNSPPTRRHSTRTDGPDSRRRSPSSAPGSCGTVHGAAFRLPSPLSALSHCHSTRPTLTMSMSCCVAFCLCPCVAAGMRSVALWDLRASLSGGASSANGKSKEVGRPPRKLAECSPQRNGIFSLHEVGGSVLTASKDGTAATSSLTPTGLSHARSFHVGLGAVKTARWRDEHFFACAGATGDVALVDTRAPGSEGAGCASVFIKGAHRNGVNDVQWSPRDSHLLLTSGPGLEMLLHDVRAPNKPVVQLVGHAKEIVPGYPQYTPAFSHAGRGVSTCGHMSNRLSLFDVASGARVWEASLADEDGDARAPLRSGAKSRLLRLDEDEDEVLLVTEGKRIEVHAPDHASRV